MTKSKHYFVILGLLAIAFGSVIFLSIGEIFAGPICPPIFGIPACYLLILFISAALISHLVRIGDRNILFFIGTGLSLALAVFASVSQIKGSIECPKFLAVVPMCYLSLILFSSLIFLKIDELRGQQGRT